MKIGKQARRDAKGLFNACRVDGLLDEGRVRDVVTRMIAEKPRDYVPTLRHFQRLVTLDVARRTARIENAIVTPPELQAKIEQHLAQHYGRGLQITYWINPALIGGLKIKVGSDIYDGSVAARLQALASRL